MTTKTLFTCPDCFGDGKDTCHNPDHGFIDAIGGELSRLGCPVYGHDAKHKVRSGGDCDTCHGSGQVNFEAGKLFCEGCDYDAEDVMSRADDAYYEKLDTTCKHCHGRGTEADYVGYMMTCVEVACSFCRGTGKAAQSHSPSDIQADMKRREEMAP